ncbi:hypothetical protein Poli38472_001669 [Pythium oligandrum]|uniref:Uncharacterized protein n=1 Tax=Pythium oligandrum TaxID=41045 RepID=A0A8K1CV45_PYTOL|nr:hypothetical protein Poli38472_001669 [Pythium oligandrum]|eukprot:TMW69513.1 hypothetical protein Poli38472_001669 [Pythium oligandrum]
MATEAACESASLGKSANAVSSSRIAALSVIPTIEVGDVDENLTPSPLDRAVEEVKIALILYNPLTAIRSALIEAHTRPQIDAEVKSRRSLLEVAGMGNMSLDLRGIQAEEEDRRSNAISPSRDELLICNLPMSIQLAFRQRVLGILSIYVGLIALAVSILSMTESWEDARGFADHSTWVFPVLRASTGGVILLSLGLLHALRFDNPINLAVLVFLSCFEVLYASLWCVVFSSTTIILFCLLASEGMVVFYVLCSCRLKLLRLNDRELLRPITAVWITMGVLFVHSFMVNAFGVDLDHRLPYDALTSVLACVFVSLGWTAMILTVLCKTMIPEEYTLAVIFFQSDILVVTILVPGTLAVRCVRHLWKLHKKKSLKVREHVTPADGTIGSNAPTPQSKDIQPRIASPVHACSPSVDSASVALVDHDQLSADPAADEDDALAAKTRRRHSVIS